MYRKNYIKSFIAIIIKMNAFYKRSQMLQINNFFCV